jgi:lactoylglutathione lyase
LSATIAIEQVDHFGIRVTDKARALAFYARLGFELEHEVDFDAVVIIKNSAGVELNLIVNGVDRTGGKNILMDVPEKHPGFTHVAFRVADIRRTIALLKEAGIATPSSSGRALIRERRKRSKALCSTIRKPRRRRTEW